MLILTSQNTPYHGLASTYVDAFFNLITNNYLST